MPYYLEAPQKNKYLMHLRKSMSNNISLSSRQHHSKILLFNPTYSCAVIKNIAKKFLQLLDQHFPPLKKFHKIFSRNNAIKVSYYCTKIWQRLWNHSTKNWLILTTTMHTHQIIKDCSLEPKHRTKNIIYKCVASMCSV